MLLQDSVGSMFKKENHSEARLINKLYGKGWFETSVYFYDLEGFPVEEQVKRVKIETVPNDTYFFREPLFFDMIRSFTKHKEQVAFVGCSSGEEVYSLYLRELDKNLIIHGYDFSEERITQAINGNYELNEESLEFLKKYDDLDLFKLLSIGDKDYVNFIRKNTEAPSFFVHDITEKALPEKYDIVACNNVLCHYTPEGREIILQNISESLNPNGLLLCEIFCDRGASAQKEYARYMKDLSGAGFKKINTIFYSSTDGKIIDSSKYTKAYKKN